MNDPVIVAKEGNRIVIRYPDPVLIRDVAWDALITTAIHVRKNLSPQAAEHYDEPTLEEAVDLFHKVVENLTTAHLGGYYHLPILLSDVAGWMLPALLSMGLSRGGLNPHLLWPDGRPITVTFVPWKEEGLLS